jgi:hypothetical protein
MFKIQQKLHLLENLKILGNFPGIQQKFWPKNHDKNTAF